MKRRFQGSINTPAAGTAGIDLPALPPTDTGWILEYVSFTYFCSAVAATRMPRLEFIKAGAIAVPIAGTLLGSLAANIQSVVTYGDVGSAPAAGMFPLIWPAIRCSIPGESIVRIRVTNADAGDIIGSQAGVAQDTAFSFVESD